jgi:hypothetical protein
MKLAVIQLPKTCSPEDLGEAMGQSSIEKRRFFMSTETRNTPLDVCRILGIAILSDSAVEDQEIEALAEMKVGEKLGVSPAEFRRVLQSLCKEAMFDESGKPNVSITELGLISEISPLLGRETPPDFDSVSKLAGLMKQADATLLADQLLSRKRLDAALDRIDDPRLQLWISCVLVRLVHADKNFDSNERRLVSYVLNRWGIAPEAIAP